MSPTDATPNQLWINQHNGTFVDEARFPDRGERAGEPRGSMGIRPATSISMANEDLFVTNIAGETSVLYINDGRGNFEDARARWGLALPTAAFTPDSARTSSTTTMTDGPICSSPTAPSTSSKRSVDRRRRTG